MASASEEKRKKYREISWQHGESLKNERRRNESDCMPSKYQRRKIFSNQSGVAWHRHRRKKTAESGEGIKRRVSISV